MGVVPILKTPNKLLEIPCEKVSKVDSETKDVIKDLIKTLEAAREPEGAGLAAPQIGVLKRILVAREFIADPSNPEKTLIKNHVLINPKIISKSKETEIDYEGCLSIPDEFGQVERHKKIKVKALNENGETIRFKATDFFARVIQHEMDHLDGILFTSKLVGPTITEKELDEKTKSH